MSALLAERRVEPERMDDPTLDEGAHATALAGLARLNALSGADRIVWGIVRPLLEAGPVRLLDVATGSGDVPVRLAKRARSAGLDLRVTGCDISEVALAGARRRAEGAGVRAEFLQLDATREPLPPDHDVVTCSLFLHHLAEPACAALLRSMADATCRLVVASDLRRTMRGLLLAAAFSRLATRSEVVRTDAVRSALAALTIPELRDIAWRAGLEGAVVAPAWPSRMVLVWRRPEGT